jgi:hypothetical protein
MAGAYLPETPAELRLLGALCRPSGSVTPGSLGLHELSARVVDWPRFLRLLQHHRLSPLAARNAAFLAGEHLPTELRTSLQAWASANAREAFRYLAALQQLLSLLAHAGIPSVVLKGVPLALTAYGDVGARDVGDIDLLIEAQHALMADEVLQQSGLMRKEPAATLTARRARFYLRNFKDFTYEAPVGGFEVDLHWRLLRDSQSAAGIMPSPFFTHSEPLRIGTLDLRVMPVERTLLFLAAHGAMEGWARWKTLADVAALWAGCTSDLQAKTWDLAAASRTTSFLMAALMLAGDWFSMTCGAEASTHFDHLDVQERGRLAYILKRARHRMLQYEGMTSVTPSSTFAMKLEEARLHPSATSRLELAQRILFRPRMWEVVDLPDSLFPLYPLFSPIEWIAFRLKKRTDRSGRP